MYTQLDSRAFPLLFLVNVRLQIDSRSIISDCLRHRTVKFIYFFFAFDESGFLEVNAFFLNITMTVRWGVSTQMHALGSKHSNARILDAMI